MDLWATESELASMHLLVQFTPPTVGRDSTTPFSQQQALDPHVVEAKFRTLRSLCDQFGRVRSVWMFTRQSPKSSPPPAATPPDIRTAATPSVPPYVTSFVVIPDYDNVVGADGSIISPSNLARFALKLFLDRRTSAMWETAWCSEDFAETNESALFARYGLRRYKQATQPQAALRTAAPTLLPPRGVALNNGNSISSRDVDDVSCLMFNVPAHDIERRRALLQFFELDDDTIEAVVIETSADGGRHTRSTAATILITSAQTVPDDSTSGGGRRFVHGVRATPTRLILEFDDEDTALRAKDACRSVLGVSGDVVSRVDFSSATV